MEKIFNRIILIVLMMIVVPYVNASSVFYDNMKYKDGSNVDALPQGGFGSAPNNFVLPMSNRYSNQEYSYIEREKLISNNYELTLELRANENDKIDFTDTSLWKTVVSYVELSSDKEYIVYEDEMTGKVIKDGTILNLNLKDLDLTKKYILNLKVISLENNDIEIRSYAGFEYGYYNNFYIGYDYEFKIYAYVNDEYGLFDGYDWINLKDFYDSYDSFTLAFELTYKDTDKTYTLKEYYCDSNKNCVLNSTENNAEINQIYFKRVVNQDLYNNTFKNINYIRYEIYQDDNFVTNFDYMLDHNTEVQDGFAKYTITDNLGNNVLETGESKSRVVNVNLDGFGFIDDLTYYVAVFETYDEDYQSSFVPFTGKQLNDGIVFPVTTKIIDVTNFYIEIAEECGVYFVENECKYNITHLYSFTDSFTVSDPNYNFEDFIDENINNFNVNALSYNKVDLSWNYVNNADGYEIYRSTKKSSGYKLIDTVDGTYYEDNSANLKTGYYYKVRAYKEVNGSILYSNYSKYKYAKGVLNKPNVTVSSYNYNTIKVSYDKVDGATGYQIYRATSKNGKYSLIKTTTSLSYLDKSRTTGKTYYYKVRAYRTISGKKYYGSYSSYKYTYSRVGTPVVSVNSYDFDSIKVSITKKPLGASGYEVYRSTSGESGTWTRVARTTKAYFYDNKLQTDNTYYYKIRAYRTVSGNRKYGNYTEAFKVSPKLTVPEIIATNQNRETILIGISEPIYGADYYEYYEIINGEKKLIETNSFYQIEISGLELGSSHTYVMRAMMYGDYKEHYSDYSDEVTILVRPSSPELYINSLNFHTHELKVISTDIKENDDYTLKIYRSLNKNSAYEEIYNGKCTSFDEQEFCNVSIESKDLYLNKTYYYKVISTINGVESIVANNDIKSLKASEKPEVMYLPYKYNKIIIGMKEDEYIDGYQIYRATSKTGKYTKVYDGKEAYDYLNTSVAKGYYYKVRFYKYYGDTKVYSNFSNYKYIKVSPLNVYEYPIILENEYGEINIKSMTYSYKKTAGDYVYYTVRISYNKTYAKTKNSTYFTVRYYDFNGGEEQDIKYKITVPKGTKRDWYTTHTIKLPKSAVFYIYQ